MYFFLRLAKVCPEHPNKTDAKANFHTGSFQWLNGLKGGKGFNYRHNRIQTKQTFTLTENEGRNFCLSLI